MSANNIIYIKKDTYEVFYQPNADEEGLGELIGKGKNLEEAVEIAEKKIKECGGVVEYGIVFSGEEAEKEAEYMAEDEAIARAKEEAIEEAVRRETGCDDGEY